ncbi:GNAT family N-acetyltransferase [Amycolatopsis antarctica]|uniref:GNAT family N-acetyltransferase n=1 Tax=Amycolatopsis antarctica TaxID=1854586 RepID=A0A263DA54_9PSEU|nr:GNAT family N-acetyltransferase [Amycolatopsis antarctica]OZM75059.1 GNAT family N-acetyltransferase [Amycolatopsis antarctica]
MEPVEINAGGYYLRQLRADGLMDDRAALVTAFADPEQRRYVPDLRITSLDEAGVYVERRAAQWAGNLRCSWAIAEPTTGELLGEVGLKGLDLDAATAEAAIWVRPESRGGGVATTAVNAVLGFGFGALGLREVGYRHARSNFGSATVAERCGFRFTELLDVQETGEPDLYWTRVPDPAR